MWNASVNLPGATVKNALSQQGNRCTGHMDSPFPGNREKYESKQIMAWLIAAAREKPRYPINISMAAM